MWTLILFALVASHMHDKLAVYGTLDESHEGRGMAKLGQGTSVADELPSAVDIRSAKSDVDEASSAAIDRLSAKLEDTMERVAKLELQKGYEPKVAMSTSSDEVEEIKEKDLGGKPNFCSKAGAPDPMAGKKPLKECSRNRWGGQDCNFPKCETLTDRATCEKKWQEGKKWSWDRNQWECQVQSCLWTNGKCKAETEKCVKCREAGEEKDCEEENVSRRRNYFTCEA